MLSLENSKEPSIIQDQNAPKRGKKLLKLAAVLAILLIVAVALLFDNSAIDPNDLGATNSPTHLEDLGSTMNLTLTYKVGEHMGYNITTVATNFAVNTSIPIGGMSNSQIYNSTVGLDVLGFNGENYAIKEAFSFYPNFLSQPLPVITINTSKYSFYNSFMAPGGPFVFYNTSSNPTISAYLAQPSVKVGDVWKIPVNTGNISLGLTGELTLKFADIQNIKVPAGTFRTMRIEVTSNTLSLHSDGTSLINIPNGMTLQLNGTSYIEQSSCLLIKANLTQLSNANSMGMHTNSTMYTEKTLVEYTKP
jgi:hypothetical protein